MAGNQIAGSSSNPMMTPLSAPPPSDHDLVERARRREPGAFDELVDRHGDRLHAMLLHLASGDRDLAAELTQEAFVRAFSSLDSFQGSCAFYTWLYRVARNRALDLVRRRRPRSIDIASLGLAAAGPSPGAPLEAQELCDQVQDALGLLDPDQREIILLRDFEGLDYGEIAELAGIPQGTVKSRLSRARAALGELILQRVSREDLP